MTMPAQECPTRITGPSCMAIARLVAATSSASEESGFWTAVTRRPLASSRGTTLAQLDPSAKAPWTKTTFFTGDAAAVTCDWSALTLRAETPQIENTNNPSLALSFEATCFIARGKQADQPPASFWLRFAVYCTVACWSARLISLDVFVEFI